MGKDAIVAGTGFEGRASVIRKFCKVGMPIQLHREPANPYYPDAIAVTIMMPRLFGLFGQSRMQIGYVKSGAASGLSKKMDDGLQFLGYVKSFYAPAGLAHPRVSLRLEWPER